MTFKNILFLSICLFIFSNCNTTSNSLNKQPSSLVNNTDRPPNPKPGECYAKCIIPDQSEIESQFITVYTGDESIEKVNVVTKNIEISPAKSEWVKKKSDRNCLSDDPNDCLVWCLVDTPAEYKEYKVLKDTTQSANYEIVELKKEKLIKKGGYTEWRTVVCENKITKSLIMQLQTELKENNFYSGSISGVLGTETKSAISQFQKKFNLPVGQLDLETMEALGVSY